MTMESGIDLGPQQVLDLARELKKVRQERDLARAEVALLKKDLEQARVETQRVLASVKYTFRTTLDENIRLKQALADRTPK